MLAYNARRCRGFYCLGCRDLRDLDVSQIWVSATTRFETEA